MKSENFCSSPKRAGEIRTRRGLTLIEMLVAATIMVVSILGFVAVWAQMMRTTLVSDNRGSAYEVAKQVMERSRSQGFTPTIPDAIAHPINSQNDPMLTTPMVARWRFFDEGLKEIILNSYDDVESDTAKPNAPAGARYCVLTRIARTDPKLEHNPSDRPDLIMLAMEVQVFDARYPANPVMYTLQDALTMGGV